MEEKYVIEDTRVQFTKTTFSHYEKRKVKDELLSSILAGKTENACYWCAELICSGHLQDIWNIVILVMSEYINIVNPKLPIYIEKRYLMFRNYMKEQWNETNKELDIRNNRKVREIFVEMICILCASKRKPKISYVKLDMESAYEMSSISDKLQAPHVRYVRGIFRGTDPSELFVPMNELAYHLSKDSMDCMSACYWIEWLLCYDMKNQKEKVICRCAKREMMPEVMDKYAGDIGWMIWEIIKRETKRRNDMLLKKVIDALYFMYSFRYNSSTGRKRKSVYYHCCYLLTELINYDIKLVTNQISLQNVIEKTNIVYRQIKRYEEKDKMDYLKIII